MSTQNETLAAELPNYQATEEIIFQPTNQSKLAWLDLLDGIKKRNIWLMLAYQDIKLRYRRSVLGPFWLTISMAITIFTMGFIYANIFNTDLAHYFPFLAGGMLAWTLLSSIVLELIDGFTVSENLIKQVKLPYTLYVHRIAWRNMLIFAHNMAVFIPIYIYYHKTAQINFATLLLIPGLILVYLNAFSYGLILAIVGARFRDMSQIVRSLVQVIFFITPVMWKPDALPANQRYVVDLNPFSAFIDIIRAPLLGEVPEAYNVGVALFITVLGFALAWKLFIRSRNRIVYWI